MAKDNLYDIDDSPITYGEARKRAKEMLERALAKEEKKQSQTNTIEREAV